MNRGLSKENIEQPERKGKITKSNSNRIDMWISVEMDARITQIAEAMKLEKATAVRMLLWFGLRFSSPLELFEKTSFDKHPYPKRLDTRITQEMLEKIEELVRANGSSKSKVSKELLDWALDNIGRYTIEDWLNN